MDWQNNNSATEAKPSADYLAPDISDVARSRGGQQHDPLQKPAVASKQTMTRAVARRLLPACFVVPAMLWGAVAFGRARGWFDLETSFVLFVFSVAVIFGVIVCIALRRLSKIDTERAIASEELRRAKENAEAANRFKSAFFANISHEIRTPLTAINGFAELMLCPTRTTDERLADARVIRRNGEHLLTLINDILDLSKIEAGKMSVERIICSPAALVGEVSALLRQRAAEKQLKLKVKFDGQIPSSIRTDPTRVRQILINLISNAIKFTKKGGIDIAVSMNTPMTIENPILQVAITDSGIGISQEQIQSLFQPFVQADATISRQYGGTGLGLAISRHFTRALGGDITVASEPGKGSTFTITIETGSLLGVAPEENPEDAMKIADTFAGPQIRMRGSVLVAEDGVDNQNLIITRLRQIGLTVDFASNGQIACEKALAALHADQPFDAILMDVQMPVMDGFTATLQLRGKGYRGPIVALTANAMERDRQKCLQAGCNDFVTKPIKMEALYKALGRYLPIEQITEKTAAKADGAAPVNREKQTRDFNELLTEAVAEIAEAIEREDRVRLKETLQLILGKSATAGMKDLAAETARFLQSAESETSWAKLRETSKEFTRTAQPNTQRQAA